MTRNKGLAAALWAFAQVRRNLDCVLVFAGEAGEHAAGYRVLAAALGIADAVVFSPGFLSEAQYRKHLLAADCGLQLREGGAGNISGTLQDCIAAGLPSVANADLAENLAAPGYVKRVGDDLAPESIAAAIVSVLNTEVNTEADRVAYCAQHSMAQYAADLMEVLGL